MIIPEEAKGYQIVPLISAQALEKLKKIFLYKRTQKEIHEDNSHDY